MATSGKLTRSSDRLLGGVCGGIAKYLGVDATLVRIVTGLVVIFTGFGPFIYALLWLILPDEMTGKTGVDAITKGVKQAKQSYDSNKLHNPDDLR